MSNHDESQGARTILLKHIGVWQLALILGALFLVAPPAARGIGNYLLYEVAKPLQEATFPAMAAGIAIDLDTGKPSNWPAFAVDRKEWVGNDLVMYGRLCKSQKYTFVDASIKYGYPEGPQAFAKSNFENRQGPARNRAAVCQLWGPWTILDAASNVKSAANPEGWTTFLIEFIYTPQHGMYNINYIAGPFDIPAREPTPTTQ